MKRRTIRSRLIAGFLIITVPLVVLLIWSNRYAMSVVHSQVAQSNQNMLTMYANQVDQELDELDKYLYKTANQDNDLISLSTYERDNPESYFAKTRTINSLYLNTNYYKDADALFAYGSRYDDLLIAYPQYMDINRKEAIKERLEKLMSDKASRSRLTQSWMLIREDDGGYSLVRLVDTGYESYIGAWVELNRLMIPLSLLHLGKQGLALFMAEDGTALTPVADAQFAAGLKSAWGGKDDGAQAGKPYRIVELRQNYLLVAQPSRLAGMYLAVMIPEANLLEGLTLFQRITYSVPALAAIMLLLYLLLLRRVILKPIAELIRGMRKIYAGDLSARFRHDGLLEFAVIGETFNKMVEQIEVLKIDIYEEQIRTQKAELKHLQAQIHPHFFMNSLNIVYNLVQTKQYELIQQMALHLVGYFRFAIRTHLTSVTVAEELEHLRNYLSVQKLRFPDYLSFAIEVEPGLEACRIPPATIQPLVENAMVHGFTAGPKRQFKVGIRVRPDERSDRHLLVIVGDNGKGMDPGTMERLQSHGYFEEEASEHVGLWNVMRRCKLYFKTDVELQLSPAPGGGVVVALRLLAQFEDE